MDEILTLAEIEKRFDSEWVLIEDPEYDENEEIVRGRVIFHSKDRDEVYRKDRELQPRSAAYLYTGEMSDDTAIVL